MSDAGEAPEVAVVRDDLGAMLDGERGEVRIGREVAGAAGLAQQTSQQIGMSSGRLNGHGGRAPSHASTWPVASSTDIGFGRTAGFVPIRRKANSAIQASPIAFGTRHARW